jgi:DAK2 domain fusion protein YloV
MMATPGTLDAEALRGMLSAATNALEGNVDAVNALNVFPVPDGDTGTNMLLTLRAVQERLATPPPGGLGATAQEASRGALLGARGNSGVILSQFLRGLASVLEGRDAADAGVMALAFREGASSAFKAVSEPVEGTLLTVMRRTADAMEEATQGGSASLPELFQAAVEGCRAAVLETPEQLPVLKEAGVVDAGGQGFALILEASLRYLKGEDVGALRLEMVLPAAHVRESFLAAAESELYGYCTQLLISGAGLDPDAIRAQVSALASSTVVVGDETLVKVHAHTFDPDAILGLGAAVGTLSDVSVENIDEQHQEFREARRREVSPAPLGVAAVAWGRGIEDLFRSLGAGAVLVGGQTMNPSTQDLLDAVESLGAEASLVLPNNSNIIPAARQAAEISPRPLHVVATRNIPQGIAAMLAYNPELDAEANAAAMEAAAASVRCGELVTAVRDATVNGKSIRAGEVMGTLDGALVASGTGCLEVLVSLAKAAAPVDGSLITLYWGGDTTDAEAQEAARQVESCCPGGEVELVYGGQPHYHYLVSIE